jgi:hypothetical protein
VVENAIEEEEDDEEEEAEETRLNPELTQSNNILNCFAPKQ